MSVTLGDHDGAKAMEVAATAIKALGRGDERALKLIVG